MDSVITMKRNTGTAFTCTLLIKVAVISVLSSPHGWRICSAAVLPFELQFASLLPSMIRHFSCTGGNYHEGSICWYINNTDNSMHSQCNDITECNTCREEIQHLACTYDDAFVCEYNDERGSCIYSNSSATSPFCFCRNSGGSFLSEVTMNYSAESNCAFAHSTSTTPQSVQACPTSQPSTTPPTGAQATTVGPQPTAVGLPGAEQAKVIGIAVGASLSFVILLVILVVICLCRRGNLVVVMKKPSKQEDETTDVNKGRRASSRAQAPEPLVINNLEYSYAYDHWPVRPDNATTVDPPPVTRTGALADEQGSVRYVTDGPGWSSTENGVRPNSARGIQAGHEEVKIEHGEEVHLFPGQSSAEEDYHAYFQVYPTKESDTLDKTPGYEEVGVPGTDAQNSAASSPYQELNRASMEDSAYQGLTARPGDEVTGDENPSSQYQHLNRAALKGRDEVDREKGYGNYEHLKGKAGYDVICRNKESNTK